MNVENTQSYWCEKKVKDTVISVHSISVRGRLHQELNLPNQDAFFTQITDKYTCLLIADGLGSCKLSHLGARAAIKEFSSWIDEQFFFQGSLSTSFNEDNFRLFIEKWKEKIDPFSYKEYDTTLHFAVYLENNLYIGGLGDGLAIYEIDDNVVIVNTRKEGFSNITESLSMIQAPKLFETLHIPINTETKELCIILATDGVSDDLNPEVLSDLPIYLRNERNNAGTKKLHDLLIDWLENWETSHHTDDRTFSLMNLKKG